MTSGDRVTVMATLNGGRYIGRQGTVESVYGPTLSRYVVVLDESTPGIETGDGRLYLNRDEIVFIDECRMCGWTLGTNPASCGECRRSVV